MSTENVVLPEDIRIELSIEEDVRNYRQGGFGTLDLYAGWIRRDYHIFASMVELKGKKVEGSNGRDWWMLSRASE